MRLRLVLLLALTAALGACVVIVDPPEKEEVPVPVPQPVPVPEPKPLEGKAYPEISQLWLFRFDRGMANLAHTYDALVYSTTVQLAAMGLRTGRVTVGSLYEQKLVWVDGPDVRAPASLESVLRYYAANAPDAPPTTCPLYALIADGQSATHLEVTYPQELLEAADAGVAEVPAPPADAGTADAAEADAGGDGGTSTAVLPLAKRPEAMLVVLVDSGERGTDAARCYLGTTPGTMLERDPVNWFQVSGAGYMPRKLFRYVVLATGEGISVEEQRKRCLNSTSFPRSALDSISPSTTSFFGPLNNDLTIGAPGLMFSRDLCAGADEWRTAAPEFIQAWAKEMSGAKK